MKEKKTAKKKKKKSSHSSEEIIQSALEVMAELHLMQLTRRYGRTLDSVIKSHMQLLFTDKVWNDKILYL